MYLSFYRITLLFKVNWKKNSSIIVGPFINPQAMDSIAPVLSFYKDDFDIK